MKKVLVILPKSIAGELIMKSFASGFETNKCLVLTHSIDDLFEEELIKFKPNLIIGYDYSYFMDKKAEEIIEKIPCKNHAFYFGDEPKSKFALGEKNELYEKLKNIDPFVFIWDEDFIQDFEKAYYLPLAASPFRYATEFKGYTYPISFVGRPLTKKRQKIICDLIKVFKNQVSIFCYKPHFERSIEEIKEQKLLNEEELLIYSKCWRGFIKTEEELAEIYNSSKVNINITEQGVSSLNYRVYEVLAAGGFLLTDEKKDIQKYFIPSKHLEIYENSTDMVDKINFYLNNLNIAQRIAQLGRLECVENHNFNVRAKFILEKIFD